MSAETLSPVRVGITPPDSLIRAPLAKKRELAATIADAGIDHLFFADHVSFRGGRGMDALLQAGAMAMLDDRLEMHLGVYLLPLRHPVVVARQLSTVSELAPGRISFGVGVGGEDRHESWVCGVDPATRGRRTDESLLILRGLLAGEMVDHEGEFFQLEQAQILPAPDPPIPIIIGGRSDAAVRRAGRFGEGWLGSWASPKRFAAVVEMSAAIAAEEGRSVHWRHGLQTWCGIGADRTEGRDRVAKGMESFYRLPFSAFEKYTPYGSPEQVAEVLGSYMDVGCRSFNLTPMAASGQEAIEAVATIKSLLASG